MMFFQGVNDVPLLILMTPSIFFNIKTQKCLCNSTIPFICEIAIMRRRQTVQRDSRVTGVVTDAVQLCSTAPAAHLSTEPVAAGDQFREDQLTDRTDSYPAN